MTRLRFERLERGWSLQKLAFHADMAVPEVSRIERQLSVPYPIQREKLARALGLDEGVLLDEVASLVPVATP